MDASEAIRHADAIDERLTGRIERHDARHSKAIEKLEGEVEALKLWRERLIGIMIAVNIGAGIVTAIVVALIERGWGH